MATATTWLCHDLLQGTDMLITYRGKKNHSWDHRLSINADGYSREEDASANFTLFCNVGVAAKEACREKETGSWCDDATDCLSAATAAARDVTSHDVDIHYWCRRHDDSDDACTRVVQTDAMPVE